MDAGLLLAGVSTVAKPPGAPPGNKIETPPDEGQNEFKVALKEAEGKSSGEVAEAEPNAQPQKLDSTEDQAKDQQVSGLFVIPLLIPAALNPSASSAGVATGTSATGQSECPTDSPVVIENDSTLRLPTGMLMKGSEIAELNVTALRVEASTATQGQTLESSRNAISVATLLPEEAGSIALTAQKVLVEATLYPGNADQTKSIEAASLGASLEIGQAEEPPSLPKSSDVKNSESVVAPETDLEDLVPSDTETETDSGTANQQGQPQAGEVKRISAEVTHKVEQSSGMTSAERKAVVHQLTQKIEALAVNSVRNEVTVRMEPAELGTVLVQVSRSAGEFTASLSASNDHLQQTLHETRNELAAALTARTNSPVKINVISPEATPMGTFSDAQRHQNPQQSPQQALTKFYESVKPEKAEVKQVVTRTKSTQIDLEG